MRIVETVSDINEITIDAYNEIRTSIVNYVNNSTSEFELSYRNSEVEYATFKINDLTCKIVDIVNLRGEEVERYFPLRMIINSVENDLITDIMNRFIMPVIVII